MGGTAQAKETSAALDKASTSAPSARTSTPTHPAEISKPADIPAATTARPNTSRPNKVKLEVFRKPPTRPAEPEGAPGPVDMTEPTTQNTMPTKAPEPPTIPTAPMPAAGILSRKQNNRKPKAKDAPVKEQIQDAATAIENPHAALEAPALQQLHLGKWLETTIARVQDGALTNAEIEEKEKEISALFGHSDAAKDLKRALRYAYPGRYNKDAATQELGYWLDKVSDPDYADQVRANEDYLEKAGGLEGWQENQEKVGELLVKQNDALSDLFSKMSHLQNIGEATSEAYAYLRRRKQEGKKRFIPGKHADPKNLFQQRQRAKSEEKALTEKVAELAEQLTDAQAPGRLPYPEIARTLEGQGKLAKERAQKLRDLKVTILSNLPVVGKYLEPVLGFDNDFKKSVGKAFRGKDIDTTDPKEIAKFLKDNPDFADSHKAKALLGSIAGLLEGKIVDKATTAGGLKGPTKQIADKFLGPFAETLRTAITSDARQENESQ